AGVKRWALRIGGGTPPHADHLADRPHSGCRSRARVRDRRGRLPPQAVQPAGAERAGAGHSRSALDRASNELMTTAVITIAFALIAVVLLLLLVLAARPAALARRERR